MMEAIRKVSDMVRGWLPAPRFQITKEEAALAVHLRGNISLMNALTDLLQSRVSGRAKVQEPSDPIECKVLLARDGELRWLLGRLGFIYHSPVNTPGSDAEQPEE